MNWRKVLKGKVLTQEPLKKHTSFRIGGVARFFIEPRDLDDLRGLLVAAKRYKIPVNVIGAGTNILVVDRGIDKIVLHLGAECFKQIACVGTRMVCGSGVSLAQIAAAARRNKLGGAEFLAGLPGTLGGSICGNAGAWGSDIGSIVDKVSVMDHGGRVSILGKKDVKFSYRSSGLAKFVVLGAVLRLKNDDAAAIKKKMEACIKERRDRQDRGFSAGCVFKNPAQGRSAGKLIDLCGLKGISIGDAVISRRHANFILNRGRASADDVLKLMRLVKKEVKDRFNVDLQPEIKIWR